MTPTSSGAPGKAAASEVDLAAEAFAGAFAFAPTGIGVFDLDGRIRNANPALCELLGVTEDHLIGGSLAELVQPQHRKSIKAWIDGADDNSPGPVHGEAWFTRPDGERRYGVVEAVFVADERGERRFGLVMAHDHTEARTMEDTLRANAHRFRALVKNVSDTVSIIGADGQFEFTTAQENPVLGYSNNWWQGRNVFELAHPDDLPRATRLLTELTEHPGDERSEQFRILHADGHWEHVQITGRNLLEDPHVRGLVLTSRNITEELHAERLLAAQAHILRLIATSAVLDETLGAIIDMVMAHADGTRASVFLIEKGRLVPRGTRHLPHGLLAKISATPPSEAGLFSAELESGDELVVTDVDTDPRVDWVRPSLQDACIHSCWSLPVAAPAENRPLGTIAMFHEARGEPAPHERRAAALAAQLTAIAVERHETESQLAHRALHDDLTGLPNRTLVLDRLTHALTRARRLDAEMAVLFLDLDRFKVVNDSLGHGAGDELLILFAERLLSIVRPEDTVARFGGDEFVIVCEQAHGTTVTVAIAERLEEAMREPFTLEDGAEVFLTASLGLAVGRGPDAEVLLRNADAAMYRAKELGRNRLEVFDDAMQAAAVARLNVGNDLRRAVERHEFVLLHQPMVDISTRRIVGSEALVRWHHPTRGILEPASFIGVTEESGLIVPIGQWVLDAALRDAREWADRFGDEHFTQSVNLSARQLSSQDLVDNVAEALERHQWAAGDLCLELTESVLLDDLDVTLESLVRLRALGVRLAIDDFGTGYSSLTYLQRFPLDAVKIDRSFVTGLTTEPHTDARSDATIPRAVVVMAHALGLSATAEGVETEDQLAVLQELGCDHAQGYLFSPPVSSEAFGTLLQQPDRRLG